MNNVSFCQFSNEVITLIFNFLSPEDLSRVSQVSQKLYEIASQDCLWRPFLSNLKITILHEMPAKKQYYALFKYCCSLVKENFPDQKIISEEFLKNNHKKFSLDIRGFPNLIPLLIRCGVRPVGENLVEAIRYNPSLIPLLLEAECPVTHFAMNAALEFKPDLVHKLITMKGRFDQNSLRIAEKYAPDLVETIPHLIPEGDDEA